MKKISLDVFIKCFGWSKHSYYNGLYMKQILNGQKEDWIEMPDEDYEEAMFYYEKWKRENELLSNTAALNNEGIELEKNGELDKAIAVYEKNISLGYPACHSFDRLMILYRKRKDYENEIRVINLALEVFSSTKMEDVKEKYNKRLAKATELLNKTK